VFPERAAEYSVRVHPVPQAVERGVEPLEDPALRRQVEAIQDRDRRRADRERGYLPADPVSRAQRGVLGRRTATK
jgi:hypothetical protein